MVKKYQYVNQCSCCDDRFSRINLPTLNMKYQEILTNLLMEQIDQMHLKGEFELVLMDGVITGAYYKYASVNEELKAKKLCNRLYDTAFTFYNMLIKEEKLLTYCEIA